MLSRAVLVAVISFLGFLTLLCLPSRAARGDDADKAKQASQLPKELEPKLFTFQAKDMPLAKVLAELIKQTGNPVEDRRGGKEENKITIDLKKATFWQALETIAKAVDARVSYDRDSKVALTDGPYLALPVSFDGMFRVTIKRIDTTLILEADTRQAVISMEVACEPRFRPMLMDNQPDGVVLQDDKGRAIEVPESNRSKGPVGQKLFKDIQVRVPAPQRSANQLGLFKGKLSAVGPIQMVTVAFDKLAKIDKANDARKEVKDGVTVHLLKFSSEGDEDDQTWTAAIALEYVAGGVKLESYQSSLLSNEIYLEKEVDGIVQRFPNNGSYETEGDEESGKAIIRYRFNDEPDRKLVLGKMSDWKLVYRVPGKLVEVPLSFEFKDVPLP